MAMTAVNFVCNIAKGRVVELYNRVKAGDPSTCRLFICVIDGSGSVTDDAVKDCDTFAAIITAGATDRNTAWTGNAYGKVLAAADLTAYDANLDDTNNWFDLDIPTDPVFTAVAASNNSTHLVICYGATATPATSALVPLTVHTFVVTTDGTDVTAQIDTEGFFRAS